LRLDKYLVEHGYYESRNRALEAIKSGKVIVDGKSTKASQKVDENSNVNIIDEKFYVSRAAKKLEGFLEEHPVETLDKRALDIGSSTGGFAQILLENGVKSLTCVDVGRDQLHYKIRDDARVEVFEETDIREFERDSFEVVSCDVSFISIMQILADIERLSKDGSDILILYKPQFEVGKDAKRDSKGVVINQNIIREKMEEFENKTETMGWRLEQRSTSKISGKEGNQEYIYHYKKVTV